MNFSKTELLYSKKDNYWLNEIWETDDKRVLIFRVESVKKRWEPQEVLLDNDNRILDLLKKELWLIIDSSIKKKRDKNNTIKNAIYELKTLSFNIMNDLEENTPHKGVYYRNEPLGENKFDYRKENLVIDFKLAHDYETRILPVLKKIGKSRNKHAVEKGSFKERMSVEYSKNLSLAVKEFAESASSLTREDVEKIRQLSETQSQQALADKYDVKRTTIADIVNYRTWNDYAFQPFNLEPDEANNPISVNLKHYDENIHELQIPFSESDKGLVDTVFEIEGKLYILKQKIHDQLCIMKFGKEGNHLADAHIRYAEPSFRNKYRNFVIISIKGNNAKGEIMDRKTIYELLYAITSHHRYYK